MPIQALGLGERDPRRVNHAIRELQRGRSNAHSTFLLSGSGVTTVDASNCGKDSHVSITPLNADAAAMMAGLYVTPGNGSFDVTCSVEGSGLFSFGIVG